MYLDTFCSFTASSLSQDLDCGPLLKSTLEVTKDLGLFFHSKRILGWNKIASLFLSGSLKCHFEEVADSSFAFVYKIIFKKFQASNLSLGLCVCA